jgi:hypothetical protein
MQTDQNSKVLTKEEEDDDSWIQDCNSIKPKYFDLVKGDLSEVKLLENNNKEKCHLEHKGSICKGFKITDHKKVNIYCEFTFFRSSKTNKYLVRPIFIKKMCDELKEKEVKKEKIIIDFKDSDEAINFWKMIGFFYEYKKLVDLNEFQESYTVVDKSKNIIEYETEEHVDKIKKIQEMIDSSNLSYLEIKSIFKSNKVSNLKIFNDLLTNNNYSKYRDANGIKNNSEELVWHHFLSENDWILGLNVDIRFLKELKSEVHIGITNFEGKGSAKADFLGIRDYTVLIELKTPSTKIFKDNLQTKTVRAGTWSFSKDFIDGISQCLAQKNQWLTTFNSKLLASVDSFNNTVRNLDTKVIFIIGNKNKEFPQDSQDNDTNRKRDTFESFRRNSRNIDIVTYDELYERASIIIHGKHNTHT